MGVDHDLSCEDCKEKLSNVARNQKLCRDEASLDQLEKFLVKHADHRIIFDADDDWVRVPDCSIFEA